MAGSRLVDARYGDGFGAGDHALAAILRYRSPFDDFVHGLDVPRKPRTRIRKRPGDAWLEATKRTAEEEATQEHEVAEALFDLANMFAAAEPVLEAEEAATTSPRAGRANTGGGHRAKRARGAKARAAEPPAPQYNSRASSGRNAQHNNAAAASGFQDALARQADASAHDYGLAAQLAASARAGEWDRASPANGLAASLGKGPGGLPGGGAGFLPPPNGLPPALAGLYGAPAGLPPSLAAGAWGGLAAPADERLGGIEQAAPQPPPFSVPNHGEHRFPRCASHVYIAHFIEYQSKLDHQRQAVRYQGFYEPGAIAPNGFQGSGMLQQNGSAGPIERKGIVKQEPAAQQPQQQQAGSAGRNGGMQPISAAFPYSGSMPMVSSAGGGRAGPPGASMPPAAALQQQQQAYAAQLSQLAMLSQQSGAAFSLPSLPSAPFLPPPGQGGMGAFGVSGGLNPQQAAAAAAAAPFFSQPGFNLASLLPPAAMAQLAATSSGMQQELKDGLVKRPPSTARLDDMQGGGGFPPQNASREEIQAWAMKNLYQNENGNGPSLQPQQQHQQQQQQQPPASQQQQQQQQGGGSNGGNGNGNSNYQQAEQQLLQFKEAFANAERERKLRTAGMMDGHSMPPNIIDAHGQNGGNSTRIVLH